MGTLPSVRASLLVLVLGVSCSTLGTPTSSDVNLPTAGVGPFRKLSAPEVRGAAPFVLDDSGALYREPSALAADPSNPASSSVYLFVVAAEAAGSGMGDVLVRTRAEDARSFYGTTLDLGHAPPVVLSADAAWEGTNLGGPSALRVGGRFFLYYAAAGGIGLAESDDGLSFVKQPGPVLAPEPTAAWETAAPSAPSVAVFPDGYFHMLYVAGVAVGEAISRDGVAWTRLDADPTTPALDPVLSPSAQGAPPDAGPFDAARVGDPCLLPTVSPAGRLVVRVLYTGFASAGSSRGPSTIGFAARFGAAGPLVRQTDPVFAVGKHEAAPALFEWAQGSMLYVQMDNGGILKPYPAVAAAFAPGEINLPSPLPYAASP